MADAIATREQELTELIAAVDIEIAAIRPKLSDLSSEALITSSAQAGIANHGEQRTQQLLALRKVYMDERNSLPFAGDYDLEAGTDAYGKDADEK